MILAVFLKYIFVTMHWFANTIFQWVKSYMAWLILWLYSSKSTDFDKGYMDRYVYGRSQGDAYPS
jgi:hypothetical protein